MEKTALRPVDKLAEQYFGNGIALPVATRFRHRFYDAEGFCCCLYDYLPYYAEMTPTAEEAQARDMVFSFKRGEAPEFFAELFRMAVAEEPTLRAPHGEWLLMPIPASSPERQRIRFESFCRQLSALLGMQNGYALLEVQHERKSIEARRGGMELIKSIAFSEPAAQMLIPGRNVLLVDDVYAKGRSFGLIADMLRKKGASQVTGVFLAQSVSREELAIR